MMTIITNIHKGGRFKTFISITLSSILVKLGLKFFHVEHDASPAAQQAALTQARNRNRGYHARESAKEPQAQVNIHCNASDKDLLALLSLIAGMTQRDLIHEALDVLARRYQVKET